MELLPIGSKGRTEVLRDAANQGIEVINHLKVEIVFSNGNGADFILELLQGFGSDAPGTAGQDKPQEGITFSIGSDRCLLGTQGESQLRQESLDLGPSLFGLGAVLTKHDEVIGVAHEAQTELIEMPVEPVEDDVCQQGGDYSSYTKDNLRLAGSPDCCVRSVWNVGWSECRHLQ